MESELFEEVGLSKNEGKAYEVLVEFGKLSAGEISSKSGVPYGRIYDVLDSLINKGIVEVIPEKTKKFIPSSPDSFLKLIDKKKQILEQAKEKVKKLKDFYEKKEKNPVIMGEGKRAFYKIVQEMKKPEKYNYSIKWTSEFKPDWAKKIKSVLRKGADIKVLTRYDEETKADIKRWLKIHKNIKKIDNQGFAFSVIDDEEVMLSLIKNNFTFLVRDKAFAKIMKTLFLNTYKSAETIN